MASHNYGQPFPFLYANDKLQSYDLPHFTKNSYPNHLPLLLCQFHFLLDITFFKLKYLL